MQYQLNNLVKTIKPRHFKLNKPNNLNAGGHSKPLASVNVNRGGHPNLHALVNINQGGRCNLPALVNHSLYIHQSAPKCS